MSNQKATPRMELVRVVMPPLGSAASNVFNMLNMMFFLTFCTEALNLNVVVVGVVMTAMRLFDGITDPIVGNIIDRTETRFGKFRPFLVIGSAILLGASFAIYVGSFAIPQSFRMVWVVLWYAVWVIGYTCMTTVNKCVLSVVTKNPKIRPVSGIAGGVYSTLIGAAVTVGIVPLLQKYGGLGSQQGWTAIIIAAFVLHLVCLLANLWAISAADKPENFQQGEKAESASLKDMVELVRINQPLRMLVLAASTDKIAATIQSACTVYFYVYGVQNLDMQPIVSAFSTPMSLIGAFVAGAVAVRYTCKRAYLMGAIANFVCETILLVFRPFGEGTVVLFVALMASNMLFRRFSAQNTDPMIAEIIDYHKLKTGKFMPGKIGATFSLLDKVISAFGTSIVGIVMGACGYVAGAAPTTTLYVAVLLMYLGAPLLGDLCSIIGLKRYHITPEEYAAMYPQKSSS